MIANHLGHQETWYNKGNPTDGLVGPDGRGIIVCGACNERLYYGTIYLSNEILTNRTIDQTYGTPGTEKKEGSTVAAKDNSINEAGLTVVDTTSQPSEQATVEVNSTEVRSSYTITAHYSRTIQDPTANFGSITCGIDVSEVMPGTLDIDTLRELAKDQFIGIKSLVLDQLGLQFSIDEETSNIMEIFPDSQVVANQPKVALPDHLPEALNPLPASEPPLERLNVLRPSRPASPAPRAPQARTATPKRPTTVPANDALWYEVVQFPQQWYHNTDKVNDRQPDYLSLKHYKADDWPVGLWLTNQQGENITPDDPDWQADFDAIPEDAFAQSRPPKR